MISPTDTQKGTLIEILPEMFGVISVDLSDDDKAKLIETFVVDRLAALSQFTYYQELSNHTHANINSSDNQVLNHSKLDEIISTIPIEHLKCALFNTILNEVMLSILVEQVQDVPRRFMTDSEIERQLALTYNTC